MNLNTSSPRSLGPLPDVGPLAFGHWRFVGHDVPTATALIETALDLGMNLIDTADLSEVRAALREARLRVMDATPPAQTGWAPYLAQQ